MAAALAQSDSELSDCSLLSLLPRTLRSSCPAGAAMSESKELDSISSFFKSTALKGSTELLEQAQMVRHINHLSIPNGQNDEVETISNKRTAEDQIELQGRRARQRRPGLLGSERMKQAFNFSAKTTAFESSQMGTTSLLKRSKISESNSEGDRESWPVIDYSCLEHIADPVEYFSTYRKLENAEKEVQRLKGDSYLTLSKPRCRRDRQRRPGILERNGKKSVFKFPGMVAAQVDISSLSNSSNYNELTYSSYSKGINQIESSEILALESKFVGNAEIHDSKGDVDTNEHDKLVHACKELDERGIANLVQKALHIKPINVKLRTPAVSTAVQYNLGSFQICKDAPAMASTSILKRSFSLIDSQDDPFFSPICNNQNGDGCKQTGDSDKIKSNRKDIYDNDIEQSQSGERGNQIGNSGKLRPNGKDSVIAKLGMETMKTKLPDAKMTARQAGHSSILQNLDLLDVNGRLAEISKLKRRLLPENSPGSQHYEFNGDDFGDLSASKSWEKHSLSPKITCYNESYQSAQNASIPVFLNGRKLGFEDKMQSPIEETMGTELGFEDKMQFPAEEATGTEPGFEDKMQSPIEETRGTDQYISSMNISEYPKRCLNSLLEVSATFQRTDSALNKTEFLSSVSEVNLEEVGQVSASVNCEPSKCLVDTHQHFGNPGTSADACFHQLGNPSPADVNIAVQEERLDLEAAKDDDLPNEMTPLDKDLETSINLNVNQEHRRASRIIENKKTRGKSSRRQQNKGSRPLRRKSLAGAGTKWESGVRRSTRIKMAPLQHWCGERFLFGRVHDSLPTIIGVKKYGTPLRDGTMAMKVKSYVSEKFADLVAQAALH